MKIKDGFLLKNILDDYLVVPAGDNIVDFAAAISLNESGAFLWKQLETDKTEGGLVEALISEYDGLDAQTAEGDVADFVGLLRSHGFLDE